MYNVGIELPKDILAYLVLFKFPPSLENLKQKIMHVEKLITIDVVYNHLIQYDNKQKAQQKAPKTTSTLSLVTTRQQSN